jgi:hypothetical protein
MPISTYICYICRDRSRDGWNKNAPGNLPEALIVIPLGLWSSHWNLIPNCKSITYKYFKESLKINAPKPSPIIPFNRFKPINCNKIKIPGLLKQDIKEKRDLLKQSLISKGKISFRCNNCLGYVQKIFTRLPFWGSFAPRISLAPYVLEVKQRTRRWLCIHGGGTTSHLRFFIFSEGQTIKKSAKWGGTERTEQGHSAWPYCFCFMDRPALHGSFRRLETRLSFYFFRFLFFFWNSVLFHIAL